jgi:hypothetical protein
VSSDKHGPIRLASYLSIHETVMEQFCDQGFVLGHTLQIEPQGAGVFTIEGRIECVGDLYIVVFKQLEVVDGEGADARVQTTGYRYNAVLAGRGNVFRYCSPHDDHNQDHHVHRYDVLGGNPKSVTLHGEDGWPTLGEVIEELRGWLADNAEKLLAVP